MSIALITGSAGLIGSEASRFFANLGFEIIGIDNDMRKFFFGGDASTIWQRELLNQELKEKYHHYDVDIRDYDQITRLFKTFGKDLSLIIHTAAQPSHDWAAREPMIDFTVNANGTLNLLEATRLHAPEAVFIFTSTNKVYGDTPNYLPLIEQQSRWEIVGTHPYYQGIPETMTIDHSLHSLFGASKVAADILVQEYGKYFGIKTSCLRCGCLTGPNHSGTQLHGFLAYLMKCAASGSPYTVFGYQGKQVRDNIHSADLISAMYEIFKNPRFGEVYNMGGGRGSNCSMLEAILLCEDIAEKKFNWKYQTQNRIGDHIWYISDLTKFQNHYPDWELKYGIESILHEIYENNIERWEHELLIKV